MKKLNKFLNFNWDSFATGKRFMTTGCRDWIDFDTRERIGTKVDFVIIEDETDYGLSNGEQISNIFEKGTFKIRKELNVPKETLRRR